MLAWLNRQWLALRAWMQGNRGAHARAHNQACCSSRRPARATTTGREIERIMNPVPAVSADEIT